MLAVGIFAACGNGNGEEQRPINQFPTSAIVDQHGETHAGGDIPEGWFAFATLDEDDNVQVLAASELFAGASIVRVDESSELRVNYGHFASDDEEEIISITVAGDSREIDVYVREENGVRTLFAMGRLAVDNPDPDSTLPTIAPINTRPPAQGTTRPVMTTQSLGTAAPVQTTRTPTTTVRSALDAGRQQIADSDMSDQEKENAFRMLSYMLDENGVFYTERDPWQKQFGFNPLMDMVSPFIQLVYGTVRLKFTYDYVFQLYEDGPNRGKVMYCDVAQQPIYQTDSNGNRIPKDWMIQLWKGRYGFVLLGAEIGIYTKPITRAAVHYDAALQEEEIIMTIGAYQHNFATGHTQYLFTRGPQTTWWITGFVPGSFHNGNANNRGKDEIICTGTLTFPTVRMMQLAAGELESAGFRRGTPSRSSIETFRTRGTSIDFSWQYMDQDARGRERGLSS